MDPSSAIDLWVILGGCLSIFGVSLTKHHFDFSAFFLLSEPQRPLCSLLSCRPFMPLFPLLLTHESLFSVCYTLLFPLPLVTLFLLLLLFSVYHTSDLQNKCLHKQHKTLILQKKKQAAWSNVRPWNSSLFPNTQAHVCYQDILSHFGVNFSLYLGIYLLPVSSDLFGQL